MSAVVLPKLTVTLSSVARDDQLETSVTLEGLDEPHTGSATASLTHRRESSRRMALELSVIRALQALQHEMMVTVHERIDRATDDV